MFFLLNTWKGFFHIYIFLIVIVIVVFLFTFLYEAKITIYIQMKRYLIFIMVFTMGITAMAKEYHVAKTGNDKNKGSLESPLLTIQAAAILAQAGDVITVHEGVYRERITPPRGGESDKQRIVYRSAPGERVEVKGSELVKNWVKHSRTVWKLTLPNSFFKDYNPYTDLVRGDWFIDKGRYHHTCEVYLDVKSLW